MKLKRLGRRSEEVGGEETEALLAHVHLPELVCERTDSRLLVCRSLTEPRRIDVLRFRWRTSVVGRLSRLTRHLLCCKPTLRGETGREQLRGLRRLAGNGAICGPGGRCYRVRAVVCLRLASCILPTFWVVVSLRRWGRGRGGVHRAVHAFGVREGGLPLRPARRSFWDDSSGLLYAASKR